MEPIRETPSPEGASKASAVWGELIVQNGRHAGKRQSLEAPLVLIGRAPSCDIRLKSNDIAPLHAALVFGATGVLLRLLHDRGAPPEPRTLRHGDLLTFGPFEFRIELLAPEPAASLESEATLEDALRIQAAAVVAQQAALTDEEIRLQQRQVALERQEAQLASHLEEKRRRLIELRNQTRDARTAAKEEHARQQETLTAATQELAGLRSEVDTGRQQVHDERVHLNRLRQRLRQRLHRHWMAERAALKRREQALAAERAEQDKVRERLQRERQEIYRSRLQLNGEAELNKRQIRDAWETLDTERCQWEEQRCRQQTDLKEKTREFEQRAIDLTDAVRNLADERRHWEETRIALEKEAEGLDARIRNQRRKLLDFRPNPSLEQATPATPEVPTASPARSEAEAMIETRLAELDQLAGELSDQRLYLAEQCERLNQARKRWQEERDSAAADLEQLAIELQQREQQVGDRERHTLALEGQLIQHQEDLKQQQRALDAWQARLAVRTAIWEGERERLLADIQRREEKAERMIAAIAQVRRRWQQRRNQEIERIQALLAVCDLLRRDCTSMRDDWLKRGKVLEKERRKLAERALSLEEYRFTFVQQSEDQAIVEQRLDKLRKHWKNEFDAAEQPAIRERQNLARTAEALLERYESVRRDLAALTQREAELGQREAEADQKQLRSQAEQDELRGEAERLRARSQIYEHQLQEINNEVERLARALLEEGESGPSLARAA
jgi:hypothetical protein